MMPDKLQFVAFKGVGVRTLRDKLKSLSDRFKRRAHATLAGAGRRGPATLAPADNDESVARQHGMPPCDNSADR